jgi:hypothetical protein
MANTITGYSVIADSYEIEEKALLTAEKYFERTPSTLKSGHFGFTIEMIATAHKENLMQRLAFFPEKFLNTASLPESIYNNASRLEYNIPGGVQSQATVMISIDYETVKAINGTDGKFVFNRNDHIHMAGFKFTLPYSIIVKTESNSAIASYDLEEQPLDTTIYKKYSSNPYLQTFTQDVEDSTGRLKKNLFIITDIYQNKISNTEVEILTDNVTDKILFEIPFVDQLVDFNVYLNGEHITKLFSSDDVTVNDRFCFWTYGDENILHVYFSSLVGYFRPQFGDDLRIEVVTTNGSNGNFEFTEQVLMQSSDSRLENTAIFIPIVAQPSGGKDKPSLMDIKKSLLRIERTRNNIITDFDVESLFKEISDTFYDNKTIVKIHKQRDDVIKRIYSVYLGLVNRITKKTYNTNTVDIDIPFTTLKAQNYILKEGTLVMYDSALKVFRLLEDTEFTSMYTKESAFLYCLPFQMELRLSPFVRSAFYDMNNQQRLSLNHRPTENNINKEFLVNGLNINRNNLTEDSYKISCSILTSDETIQPYEDIKVIAVIKGNNTELYYTEMLYNNTLKEFYFHLKTDNTFDNDGRLIITDSLKEILTGTSVEAYLGSDINVDIHILYKDGLGRLNNLMDTIDTSEYVLYSSAATVSTPSTFKLYQSMNDVVYCQTKITQDGLIHIKNLPLVHFKTFLNNEQRLEFKDSFNKLVTSVRTKLSNLHNNTSIDVKFVNTFGPSKLFSSPSTNVKVELEIDLHGKYSDAIDLKIRTIVNSVIQSANEASPVKLAVSNIIARVENEVEDVSAVVFKRLSNGYAQTITKLYVDDSKYVPEILSIDVDKGAGQLILQYNGVNL